MLVLTVRNSYWWHKDVRSVGLRKWVGMVWWSVVAVIDLFGLLLLVTVWLNEPSVLYWTMDAMDSVLERWGN